MDNFENIIRMEKILEDAQKAVDFKDFEKLKSMSDEINELINYYESDSWLSDFEADEAGLIPKDLKRGVLSEDEIYNLILDLEEFNFKIKTRD